MSIRSITPGNQSTSFRCRVWSKIRPVRAASWWARATTVRSASGSPVSATTFQVVLRSATARRSGRAPLEMSSAINAVAAAPPASPTSLPLRLSAAIPAAAAAALTPASIPAKPSRNSSSSTRASRPTARRRWASHSAASRSPSEPARRSIGASASTTSRSVALGRARGGRGQGCVGAHPRRARGAGYWTSTRSTMKTRVSFGRDVGRPSLRAVAEVRRDDQLSPTADLHPGNALVPAGDHASRTELERVRLAPVPGGVELLAVRVVDAHVLHRDRVAGLRLGPAALGDVVDLEAPSAARPREPRPRASSVPRSPPTRRRCRW